jgi:CRISPR-associated protein Csm3
MLLEVNNMQVIKYKAAVNVLSPFNISSGQDQDGFIDKRTVLYNDKVYIPGSTIKGKIRNNFYKIVDLNHMENDCDCVMCTIFGGSGYNPSRMYVDDFMPVEDNNISIRFGNAIDRYRKIAKDGALFAQEVVNNSEFIGQITVYFDEKTMKYKESIELAINMIDSIGNGRSRGYGRVKVCLEEVTE